MILDIGIVKAFFALRSLYTNVVFPELEGAATVSIEHASNGIFMFVMLVHKYNKYA